jgi:hypothetical protein
MFSYFEREGAYFRRRGCLIPGAPVDQVFWPRLGWVDYHRDPVGVAWYGNPISKAELPAEAREQVNES